VPPKKAASARCPTGPAIAALASYRGEGAKFLEQEELAPAVPDLSAFLETRSKRLRGGSTNPGREASLVGGKRVF
jgi:hypothetical protein